MATALVLVFLIVHGLLHLTVWLPPAPRQQSSPFDPKHSAVLSMVGIRTSTTRTIAVSLAAAATIGYTLAALGVATDATWWRIFAVGAAAIGIVLKVAYFNPWLLLGLALDIGVIAAVAADWPAALP